MTQDELKQVLDYNPDSGEFFWKQQMASWIPAGTPAGNLNKKLGYVQIRFRKKLYYAHRLAVLFMTGELPSDQVDHINGIRSDNRWDNLRKVTNTDNQRNAAQSKNNVSGVVGVCWDKRKQKWLARIYVESKPKFIGYFADIPTAALARKEAEKLLGYHQNHGRNTQ